MTSRVKPTINQNIICCSKVNKAQLKQQSPIKKTPEMQRSLKPSKQRKNKLTQKM